MTDSYTTHVTHTRNGMAVSIVLGDCRGASFWVCDQWATTFNRYLPCIERRGQYSPNHLAFHVKSKRLRKKYALVKDIILMRSIRFAPYKSDVEYINEYITREDGTSTYDETGPLFCGAYSTACQDEAT